MNLSIIINLHNEGRLANATILSVIHADQYLKSNDEFTTEILLILDNPNSETVALATHFSKKHLNISSHICDKKDLGASRNFGVSIAKGEFISFIDGDDLFSEYWLLFAFQNANQHPSKDKVVWHPEVNVIFESDYHLYYHIDMEDPSFDIDYLNFYNYWTALSFAHKTVYEKFPYKRNKIKEGYGYEDWSFNITTIKAGLIHKIVPNTCHFVRRKEAQSLLQATNANECLVSSINGFTNFV